MVTSHHCVTRHDVAGPSVGQLLPATGRGTRTRRAAPATGHCSSVQRGNCRHRAWRNLQSVSIISPISWSWQIDMACSKDSTLHTFWSPIVNSTQDKPKSLRMCRVCSWIGWLHSFNSSLQGKWICCKPFLFTLLCWLVPGFVFLFFVGRKIFGCSISCSSSDGAEMETAASARHGAKLGDLMDLQLKMSFAIFFGVRSEKSGRWLCF